MPLMIVEAQVLSKSLRQQSPGGGGLGQGALSCAVRIFVCSAPWVNFSRFSLFFSLCACAPQDLGDDEDDGHDDFDQCTLFSVWFQPQEIPRS